jgi:hypothetical protein
MLREMIEADPLPDYLLEEEPGDILRVTPRDAVIEAAGRPFWRPTYEAARALLPGCGCLRAGGRMACLVGGHRPTHLARARSRFSGVGERQDALGRAGPLALRVDVMRR